jgi:hypothetical protein
VGGRGYGATVCEKKKERKRNHDADVTRMKFEQEHLYQGV